MKKFIFIGGLVVLTAAGTFFSCRQKGPVPAPEKAIAQALLVQVDSFSALCGRLQTACGRLQTGVKASAADEQPLQDLFLQARLAYKRFEWAAEYFEPAASRSVNGPPVPEVEMASHQVFEPAGLQVIEGYLFPKVDPSMKSLLIGQLTLLQAACNKYRKHFGNIDIFDWQVFDAVKLEVFRIETLGISGFDNPLTLRSLAESAAGLESLKGVMDYYGGADKGGAGGEEADKKGTHGEGADKENADKKSMGRADADKERSGHLKGAFDAAIGYLNGHSDFNAFNRAEFIISYCNPLTTDISDLVVKLKIRVIRYNRLLNQDAKTLFEPNAFNINAYAPDPSSFLSEEKIALGKVLFADPSLSGTGTRSCQSCHQPGKAFTDGLVKNTVIGNDRLTKNTAIGNGGLLRDTVAGKDGLLKNTVTGKDGLLKRNTPTLLNAALQPSQFYDMRVNTLEDQSLTVVQSILEMHGSMTLSVGRLWKDKQYRELFSKAFPKKDRTGIDTLEIMNAIGSYVRSLVALNSRFDEYMRGNRSAMNAGEINGFNLFMGKAKCATCHYMPLFNGTFPPRYVKTESEVIGVPGDTLHKKIDDDMGRYAVIETGSFRHAFKIPTVRNAARTAPYMHNGVFTSLEQVMDFYNKGGGVGMGMKIENQTLPFDKLELTEKERGDVILFIKSLDSR